MGPICIGLFCLFLKFIKDVVKISSYHHMHELSPLNEKKKDRVLLKVDKICFRMNFLAALSLSSSILENGLKSGLQKS